MKKLLFSCASLLAAVSINAQAPTEGPAAPTVPAGQVMSIYSNTYESVAPAWTFGEWGSGTVQSDVDLDGNQCKKYVTTNLGYFGWQFEVNISVSAMKYLHADVYAETATPSIRFVPITGAPEVGVTANLKQGEWTSIDIPLSEFTGANLGNVFQIKYDNIGAGTIYIDNVYFYTDEAFADEEAPTDITVTLGSAGYQQVSVICQATDESPITFTISVEGTELVVNRGAESGKPVEVVIGNLQADTEYVLLTKVVDITGNEAEAEAITVRTLAWPEAAPTPTQNETENAVISLYSDAFTSINDFNPQWWGQSGTANSVEIAPNEHAFYLVNLNYQGWQFAPVGSEEITHFHFDVYAHTGKIVAVTPIWSDANGATHDISTVTVNDLAPDTWRSVDVALDELNQGKDIVKTNFFQFKVDAQPDTSVSGKEMFFDNIYFYKEKSSGVENVAVANNGKAVYYNLAGVRVDNPANGLYIEIRDGKATKTYVK